jgi:two-component sensor histidine kinase
VEVSEEVYDMCIGSGFSAADAYHISLCTEELAANSIEHGFNDGKKHSLEARVLIGEDDLYLRLRDDYRRSSHD